MRDEKILYFSSTVKFEDLDFEDKKKLSFAFRQRMHEFYFEPADELLADEKKKCNAFAVGVLCATTIDSLAKITMDTDEVGERIKKWLKNYIAEFHDDEDNNFAKRFYKDFRNGLVHEGFIKNGGQFSYDFEDKLICERNGIIIINPRLLLSKTKDAFNKIMDEIEKDNLKFQLFKCALIKAFYKDIEYAKNNKTMENLNS